MINILANDGISNSGIELLEKNGFNIDNTHVDQDQLIATINSKKYEMNLTSGNINFLKILSIIVLVFFIAYWSLRIINN